MPWPADTPRHTHHPSLADQLYPVPRSISSAGSSRLSGAPAMTRISRRDLFRGPFGESPSRPPKPKVQQEPARPLSFSGSGQGKPLPLLRPPCAIAEEAFLSTCTRCHACVKACPHHAIVPAPVRLRGAAQTPILDPFHSPCRMCDDLPCVQACPTGSLCLGLPVAMGIAMISPPDCLAHQNNPCSACVEQCPVPEAIDWVDSHPTVLPELCTGCGICQHVCPAPRNAVILMPRRQRPDPTPQEMADGS